MVQPHAGWLLLTIALYSKSSVLTDIRVQVPALVLPASGVLAALPLYFVGRENKMSHMSTITKEWITVAEAAERLKCSPRTVLRLADSEIIEKFVVNPRMYLVKAKDVDAEAKRGQLFGRPRGS